MSSQMLSMRNLVSGLSVYHRLIGASTCCTLMSNNKRHMATEAKPEDYGYYPDPLEHATGLEKKMLIARLAGDDRYEPKIYYRSEQKTTKDNPNLVPAVHDDRMLACMCQEDSTYLNFMMLRKGQPKRCECGHWFKAVDTDPDSF